MYYRGAFATMHVLQKRAAVGAASRPRCPRLVKSAGASGDGDCARMMWGRTVGTGLEVWRETLLILQLVNDAAKNIINMYVPSDAAMILEHS